MTKRIYMLMGGVQSWDGIVTSSGMNILLNMLKGLGEIKSNQWANYQEQYFDIMRHQDDKIIGIGYSGGGAHFTWIANGYREEWEHGRIKPVKDKKPKIDLLVLYDPSPKNGIINLEGSNVKRCINYHSTIPLMFGLGGGKVNGPMVENVDVHMPHLAMQFSMDLHRRTVNEINLV